MTVTIQIGNTDDKLKQAEWASYVRTMVRVEFKQDSVAWTAGETLFV